MVTTHRVTEVRWLSDSVQPMSPPTRPCSRHEARLLLDRCGSDCTWCSDVLLLQINLFQLLFWGNFLSGVCLLVSANKVYWDTEWGSASRFLSFPSLGRVGCFVGPIRVHGRMSGTPPEAHPPSLPFSSRPSVLRTSARVEPGLTAACCVLPCLPVWARGAPRLGRPPPRILSSASQPSGTARAALCVSCSPLCRVFCTKAQCLAQWVLRICHIKTGTNAAPPQSQSSSIRRKCLGSTSGMAVTLSCLESQRFVPSCFIP